MSAAYWSAGALKRKLIKSDLESNGKIKRKRFFYLKTFKVVVKKRIKHKRG